MPRRGRIVVPGLAHHVTQRGNNGRAVFDREEDRALFLELLAESAGRCGVAVWGYCLMTNHYHVVAVPEQEDSLARAIGRLEADYARYLNVRRRVAGHLWQARYYSVPMDDRYRWRALAYVERNPVRAGMVGVAWEYGWSRAAARVAQAPRPEWLRMEEWERHWTSREWVAMLEEARGEGGFGQELRAATLGGHPLGRELTERLESSLGMRLRPGKAGRPRKQAAAGAARSESGGGVLWGVEGEIG